MHFDTRRYLITTLILLTLLFIVGAIASGELVKVTIIDNIFDGTAKHEIGLVRFILDDKGEKIDYKIIGRVWSDRKKVLQLKPGSYGITATKVIYLLNPYKNEYIKTRSIISYIEATVSESDNDETVYLDPRLEMGWKCEKRVAWENWAIL